MKNNLTKLEEMENVARFIGYSKYEFPSRHWAEVVFEEEDSIRYFLDGAECTKQSIIENIPDNALGFEHEAVKIIP